MRWKNKYSTSKGMSIPKIGMVFVENPNSDKSGWEDGIQDIKGAQYTIKKINNSKENPIILKCKMGQYIGHKWHMDNKFLQEHFILVKEK